MIRPIDSICPSHVHTKHITQNTVHERLLMGASNVLHTPVVQYVEPCCSQNTEGSTVLSQASQTSWSILKDSMRFLATLAYGFNGHIIVPVQ